VLKFKLAINNKYTGVPKMLPETPPISYPILTPPPSNPPTRDDVTRLIVLWLNNPIFDLSTMPGFEPEHARIKQVYEAIAGNWTHNSNVPSGNSSPTADQISNMDMRLRNIEKHLGRGRS
jgi:hypothetical protein